MIDYMVHKSSGIGALLEMNSFAYYLYNKNCKKIQCSYLRRIGYGGDSLVV